MSGGWMGLLMLIQIQGDSQETTWAVLIFMSSPCARVCVSCCKELNMTLLWFCCHSSVYLSLLSKPNRVQMILSAEEEGEEEVGCNHGAPAYFP